MILDKQLKMIVKGNGKGDDAVELYNLQEDPAEQHDLSASQPADVQRLRIDLQGWQESVLNSLTGADYDSTLTESSR